MYHQIFWCVVYSRVLCIKKEEAMASILSICRSAAYYRLGYIAHTQTHKHTEIRPLSMAPAHFPFHYHSEYLRTFECLFFFTHFAFLCLFTELQDGVGIQSVFLSCFSKPKLHFISSCAWNIITYNLVIGVSNVHKNILVKTEGIWKLISLWISRFNIPQSAFLNMDFLLILLKLIHKISKL